MSKLSPALQIIADDVGLLGTWDAQSIMELARTVKMENLVITNPQLVAHEITHYLDDLVENP